MPLDERIQRLSETIIHEVQGPIEEALHRLLADVMAVASDDRERAVQEAVSAAAVDREAALAALREQAGRDGTDAEALREQFAAERDAALASLREELDRERDAAFADFRDRVERDRDAALAALRTQLEHERDAKLADLRAQLERERDETVARRQDELVRQHEAALEALREEAAAEVVGASGLTVALADAERAKHDVESRVSVLELELDQARLQAEEARRAAGEAQRAAGEAQHAGEQARQDLDRARQDADNARRDADQATAELDLSRAAADRARAEVDHAQAELDQARRDAALAQQAHRDEADARQLAEERRLAVETDLQLAHAADRQEELACSDRMLGAFRRLDDARSLTEVLGVLADQAEHEIGRAALLLVTGSRLRSWEWRGIAGSDAPVDVRVDPDSVFGRAIATGLPASTSDAPLGSDGDPLAARLTTPPGRAGLAIPISVGGRAVAILYADDAGERTPVVPSNWPELAEILARHAGRCLELLTISRASALAAPPAQDERLSPARPGPEDALALADEQREEESARRYARLLISEIKLYNEPAVEQGRTEHDLLTRLGPEIERTRRLYEEKIPAAVRQRVDCFDEEVVRTLAGGDAGLLGKR